MEWHEMYPSTITPTMDDIAQYTGKAKPIWQGLISHIEAQYKAKPKINYSSCGGKPGWNVKYQKSGKAFGTLYPEEDGFSVFVVIGYKLDALMEAELPNMTEEISELYRNAGDFMKTGKWMMFRVDNERIADDYKRIIAVKMSDPK